MKKTIITIIRAAVGWHFLYEGCIKLFAAEWSAASYLNNTIGFLSGFYHWLAGSSGKLAVVDFLNVWGLILIGLGLFVGLCIRWASLAGALLLTLYYLAYPPFGVSLIGGDGTVYLINQIFIEAAILVFFFYNKEKGYGLDDLIQLLKKQKQPQAEPSIVPAGEVVNSRREVLKDLAALPVLGLFGWGATRSAKIYDINTVSGATIQVNRVALGELKGELPKGKLGNHELTRLVLGAGIPVASITHARDLLYVGRLARAYHTEKKIYETLMLCEQAGINCVNSSFSTVEFMAKYKKVTGSKIKVIAQVKAGKVEEINDSVDKCIDLGMDILQLQGNNCDDMVRDRKLELLERALDRIRKQGIVAGMGAHAIETLIVCEENGIIPDYYMKTMHHNNYWSAHPMENRKMFEVGTRSSNDHNMYHDNSFDPFPDQTIEFVNRTKIPVMGFKVLAAGAIHPKDGFKYALENGADFVCAGMFDFQVVDDINIFLDTMQNLQNRTRAWYA